VNAVIPPISLVGPTLTIRKFAKTPISIEQLIQYGSITQEALQFVKACVEAKLNIVISGGTGSGKTTLLNVLSSFIPGDDRILTIENAAELQLRQEHVVTLESRPPNIEGRGEITIRQLVVNALRMRPDRIIVGEIRDEAALDMLQAMNTGHDGSMTTAHSNSPRDTLTRLETMTLMAGMELPVRAIREQVASAIDLVVHQERMRDGSRKIVNITEVSGMEGDVITTTDIFVFEQTGYDNGKVVGRLRPTGLRPKFMDKIEAAGIHLPPSIFGVGERRRY
jgi:pilus assembly protein CpaF